MAIYSSHTLEHLDKPLNLLKTCYNSLETGGTLQIVVPNLASLSARTLRTFWYFKGHPWHLNGYTPASLVLSLNKAGFENVSISSFYDALSLVKNLRLLIRHKAGSRLYLSVGILLLTLPFNIIFQPRNGDHLIATCVK
jgi:hypothetical protein